MDKSISIIGCGWLGLPLGQKLIEEGYEVRGSTTTDEKIALLEKAGINARLFQVGENPIAAHWPKDLLQSEALCITIPPGRKRPDVEQWYPAMIDSLLYAALAERQIKQVIFTSSTSVYGQQEGMMSEERPLSPASLSAKGLVKAEKLISESKLDWIVLRLAGLYGPKRHPGRWLAEREDLPNGNDPLNLVHQEDVIQIIARLLEMDIKNEVFNLCADQHPAKRDFYPKMSQQLGLKPPTYLPTGKSNAKQVSNKKVTEALSYNFRDLYEPI